MSKLYQFTSIQKIPSDLETVWQFISSPLNLKTITPPYMGFDMVAENETLAMYTGQIISYTVRPLFGLPLSWVTEITHVVPGSYFVDEQRFGPYTFWHHQHFIRQVPGGVEMKDIVHYKLPFGLLGDLVNALVVQKKLKEIFAYRRTKIEELWGTFH